MNDTNSPIIDDEIDLLAIIKNLFRQRGLIIAFTLAFLLLGGAFQFSKLAFYAPKAVSYPIAVEFIASGDKNYPNGTSFSPEDIISPENIKSSLESAHIDINIKSFFDAISVDATNALIKGTEASLLQSLAQKKIPQEQVKEVKEALKLLKYNTQTYITLTLDLSKMQLADERAKELLKVIVNTWAENAIKKGLINPNISYPKESFVYDKEAAIIDNYDKLLSYSKDLSAAFKGLSGLQGSHSISIGDQNLNDLSRKVNDIINNDINVMRSYAYSVSPELIKHNKFLEIQIFSQLRVKELDRAEIQKKIEAYDFVLTKLNSNTGVSTHSQQPLKQRAIEANLDQNVLNDLLDLGSKVSSSDLKKEIINKRIAASEKLFSLEKEIDMISGNVNNVDMENQQKVVNLLPSIFAQTAEKINKSQQVFMLLLEKYNTLFLNKGSSLYSSVASPYVVNSLSFPLKRSLLVLLAATFMGLFIGIAIALMRASFLNNRKNS
ncbi:Wzz/FepE/Etk N-terminal domain-containing protein [Pasteurella skyensis]|uniref:Wzz/FepE/Etk N-terminal domain-containing protein n=1 Tax=Phocoenobacter skyensis TaxID=97481 RepID=A0AAJ6P0Z4_9PAST|nr:Wzz/FepE/Etk N-terminal domain-containing protein [Pasteurella skyensis]MDP8163039.1 Wzz/FepE/Etk N-terminal domain-containing protein [Pasteurella skyensis]MDP8173100.1 Wzz/FepE/Etk N-terminal domain-containing protein [Pasteurella skyensis]MDP8176323.1 Wzz/FepE/Etk N-terminal domain-containing protein [Pasteurella skyensis]MDP8178967.1 Wzz/FepE/Etk N-terminal domain-containing protein [Pasteurella skyensis]MDP8183736.1 Wzz/FepE/Etk N-terminal domain-containing protein [Pasteurella skyensi